MLSNVSEILTGIARMSYEDIYNIPGVPTEWALSKIPILQYPKLRYIDRVLL